MTPDEVAVAAEALRNEVNGMGQIGYSNYKAELAEYRRILNDLLVCIRETAKNQGPPPVNPPT
jgi:hypothetical protein